jgi:lipopolysaccharide transport system ATP-binding protein
MREDEWHIGISGTFDVENYGDLLFPLIAEAELVQRLGPITLHRFSYNARSASAWSFAVRALAELPEAAGALDGLILGGGDLIRFDKGVAPGYGPPEPGLHHPTGYWLTPMLIALQQGCPVVWNAPGVHGAVPTWAAPLLELVIRLSSYVTVRDEASCQALRPYAERTVLRVVPDTVFGVSRLVDVARSSPAYTHLCADLGLRAPYILVQAAAGLEAVARMLRANPQRFASYQVVVLPIGPALCDDADLVASQLPGALRVAPWPAPLLIAELIGRAAAVVGISLHLAITALAFGVPVFRPSTFAGGKFAALRAFDTVHLFEAGADLDPAWFMAGLGRRDGPEPAALDAARRLSAHWDALAAALVAGQSPGARAALGRFWQTLPIALEGEAVRTATALAERDAWAERCGAAVVERDDSRAERDALVASASWKLTRPLRALSRKLRLRRLWR